MVADRTTSTLARLGVGPERLLTSAIDAPTPDLQFLPLQPPVAIPPVEVHHVDEDAPATDRYREMHTTWPASHTAHAGIVTARRVHVSMPTGMHRWRRRVVEEALLGVDALRNPKYLAAFAHTAVPGQLSLAEGVLLALPWNHNFYHWMVEQLPRLALVDEVHELRDVPLLVPASAPAFVTESLRLCGYDDRALHLDDGVYRVDTMHIPSRLSTASNVSPLALQWLDARFPDAPPAGRRIYVSRADAAIRTVSNEHEVARMLELELGFETVVVSHLSLADQVRLFREAAVIVGAHGAALAHVAFAPRGSALVEIFQDGHFSQCYGLMATMRGMRYGLLVAARRGLSMHVDVNALRRVVGEAVAAVERHRREHG
ncbi:MAG TPA: glycosyltransferase family 61 protein [Acidimicrobiales bacterium]